MMATGGKILEGSSAEPTEAGKNAEEGDWSDILPFTDGSHRSARISIPREEKKDAAAAAELLTCPTLVSDSKRP